MTVYEFLQVLGTWLVFPTFAMSVYTLFTVLRNRFPYITVHINRGFYQKKNNLATLVIRIFPGTEEFTIRTVEVFGFDCRLLTENPVPHYDLGNAPCDNEKPLSRSPMIVDWRIPPADECDTPLEIAVLISCFNLSVLDAISMRIRLRSATCLSWITARRYKRNIRISA